MIGEEHLAGMKPIAAGISASWINYLLTTIHQTICN